MLNDVFRWAIAGEVVFVTLEVMNDHPPLSYREGMITHPDRPYPSVDGCGPLLPTMSASCVHRNSWHGMVPVREMSVEDLFHDLESSSKEPLES